MSTKMLVLPVRSKTPLPSEENKRKEKKGRFLVVFHGTDKSFQSHEIKEKSNPKMFSGKGIWTTTDMETALMFGKNIHKYVLDTAKAKSHYNDTYFSKRGALIAIGENCSENFVSIEQLKRR